MGWFSRNNGPHDGGPHHGGPRHGASRARRSKRDSSDDRSTVEPAQDSASIDLVAVRLDDELLDRLSARDIDQVDQQEVMSDQELVAILASWRHDVDSEQYRDDIDTDTALAALRAGRSTTRRTRFLVPFASAAAVLAVAFTGISIAAKDAHPGDALWGLTQILYADHARSVAAAFAVRSDLTSAQEALSLGEVSAARSALASAKTTLPSVLAEDGRAKLASDHQNLMQQLDKTTPSSGQSSSSTSTSTSTTPSTPTTTTSTTPTSSTTPPTSTSQSPTSSTSPSPTTTTDVSGRSASSSNTSSPTLPH